MTKMWSGHEVADILTDDEKQLVKMLGECASLYGKVTRSDGVVIEQNRREFVNHVHDLQNMVLARGSARFYPERFRL